MKYTRWAAEATQQLTQSAESSIIPPKLHRCSAGPREASLADSLSHLCVITETLPPQPSGYIMPFPYSEAGMCTTGECSG